MLGAPQRTWALILGTRKLGDTSKIVSALSAEFGRVQLVAKGARQLKGRSFAILEPGNELELLVYARPGRELWTLGDAQLLRSALRGSAGGLGKLTHLFAALELAERLLPMQEPVPELVDLYRGQLDRWHDGTEDSMAAWFFALEIRLASELGIALDIAHCAECGEDLIRRERAAFALAEGVMRCDRCAGPLGRWLDASTLGALRSLSDGGGTELEGDAKRAIGRLLHEHLGFHLPNYRIPRSLYWLREASGDPSQEFA